MLMDVIIGDNFSLIFNPFLKQCENVFTPRDEVRLNGLPYRSEFLVVAPVSTRMGIDITGKDK